MTPTTIDVATVGFGLLLARLVFGLLMAAHGAQKLLGWFGGYGLTATGQFMTQLGFTPGRTFAAAAAISEVASGLLIAAGFLGPIGPAIMLSVMIVAAVTVHLKNGVFATTNGIELPLLYAATAIGFAFVGFGQYSLDSLFGITPHVTSTIIIIALLGGAIGAILNLAARRKQAAPAQVQRT
jgi:putative oxidoreductase